MSNSPLSKFADIYYGKSPNGFRSDSETNYQMFGTGGVVGYATKPIFESDGVVIPRKGSLNNPSHATGKYWVIDTAYAALPKQGFDAKWLYYQLSNYDLSRLNEATGVPSISRDWLYKVEFFESSLKEQQKVAQILSSIDEQIELTEKLIEKKGLAKKGLLVNFFSVQPEEPLRNIANVIMGQSPSSTTVSDNLDDGLPFLQGCAEFSRRYPIPFKSCFGECKRAPPKSVLISVRAPVGDTNLADQEYAIGRGLAAIFPKGEVESDYLALAIEFSKPKLRKVAQGSTFEAVGSQDILNLKINFHYEIGERNEVTKILNAIDGEIEFNIRLLKKLKFQKQGLMQDLLTGQVRVS